MHIPTHIVDEIYKTMDIVEIVSDYATLKKKGANYWALSPFVKEKTPSFAVNPVKGIYKCFSSGKGGNAINFIMEMEGITYGEALAHVAKKYNIEIPLPEKQDAEFQITKNRIESLYIISKYAADFFHYNLLETAKGKTIGLPYFKERGILESTIKTFQLGYALEEWDALAKDALGKQYQEQFLVETGLCIKSERTGALIDRFRDRIIFPITNVLGKIVGFGGRILKKDEKEAKYLNSPESEIYHKSQTLFGLSQAKNEIRNKDLCLLTEGYMDVLALYQAGIQNVVASSGTSLTEEQAKLIRRFTKNVIIVYDGDAPGIKAALRGIDILITEGLSVRVLILPDNHDPDSYTKAYGATAFLKYLNEKAADFMEFKIQQLRKVGVSTPREQSELLRALGQTLARIPDLIEQSLYIQDTAHKMGVSPDLLSETIKEAKGEIEKRTAREQRRQQTPVKTEVIELKTFETLPLAEQEKELFRVLLNYHDKTMSLKIEGNDDPLEVPVYEYFIVEMEGLSFSNAYYEEIKNAIFASYQQQIAFNINDYLNHPDPQMNNIVSELLAVEHTLSENWIKFDAFAPNYDENLALSIQDPLWYYRFNKINSLIQEVMQKMDTATTPEEEDELLTQFLYLKQVKQNLATQKGIEGAITGNDVAPY